MGAFLFGAIDICARAAGPSNKSNRVKAGYFNVNIWLSVFSLVVMVEHTGRIRGQGIFKDYTVGNRCEVWCE